MTKPSHSTPHVFAPTTDEFRVKYRCLLCGWAGQRKGRHVVACKQPQDHRDPLVHVERYGARKPTLDDYDRNPEREGY